MPVPAEATPQPGQRFLMLPSASSPLGRLDDDDDGDDDDDDGKYKAAAQCEADNGNGVGFQAATKIRFSLGFIFRPSIFLFKQKHTISVNQFKEDRKFLEILKGSFIHFQFIVFCGFFRVCTVYTHSIFT